MHDLFALNGYIAITESSLGEGRTDLLIKGIGSKPSIVFELKVLDSDGDLGKEAEADLKQISDRRYVDNPEMKGSIALSIAFRKKTCEVRFL